MKNLNIQIDDNTSYTFFPFSAELNVRGVVTFETNLEGVDFEFLSELVYGLMEGEPGVDPAGGEYKSGHMELRVADNDDEPSSQTFLRVNYAAEIEGQRSEVSVNLPESSLVQFWNANRSTLMEEAAKLDGAAERGDADAQKNLLALGVVIEALRFVSGEAASFAPAFMTWAAELDREANVKFPSILPMAA
ncbi:hypothetical protein QQS45_03160 [Alteriqipengyuania flavescens]|uniref:hypothetical protein n=1 Tax=Alteriqipengyuania flavescens TaxID=3053610 RepID=UPI0025B2CD8D|nr:hypothetical protein [Alteriqipengyuania flavescens]WJY19247.1 hypothetical protein QQW98_03155 [Alteriqipengyuania flavescens]WJY25188.1 hypothetical protein QQS45_03160 [Alteriqipengyuania flavescens]